MIDAHAHLDEVALSSFVEEFLAGIPELTIISNSVDPTSSIQNLELARKSDRIIPFVGIHPDFVRRRSKTSNIDNSTEEIAKLTTRCAGIGEIGMDPKYGSLEDQEKIFVSMLSLGEKTNLPVSIHSRDSVAKILQMLSTFNLKGSVLFHWFAGTEAELAQINDGGFYVSYGPSILFSKRMAALVQKTRGDLILAETDSPTSYASLLRQSTSTPFLIGTTVFKISLLLETKFDEMNHILSENALRYLRTQNSLRVK